MTVEIDTPIGPRTGSGVIEIANRRVYDPLSTGTCGDNHQTQRFRSEARGDAVVVKLDSGRKVFALLRTHQGMPPSQFTATSILQHLGIDALCPSYQIEQKRWRQFRKHSPADMPLHRALPLPAIATFGNIADPNSIYAIDPLHLDLALGRGYRLNRITLESTRDPVTRNIQKDLPWIDRVAEIHPYVLPAERLIQNPERVLTAYALRSPVKETSEQ